MNRTTARLTALTATAMIALAGCGITSDQDDPVSAPTIEQEQPASDAGGEVAAPEVEAAEEEPAVEQGGPGVYQVGLYSGGTATVSVPGTGPDDLEQYRQDAGVDPVGYLVVEVDNTEGTDEAMIFEASIVDSEGKTYTYTDVMTGTSEWAGDNMDLWERETELWDKYPYNTLPSATNTVPLIGPEVPEDIVSVFIDSEQADRVGDL